MRIAHEVEAQRVVDVGCGTGSLAVRLAARGFSVTGVDPAVASLDVARAKPHGELVTWVHGDATSLVGIEAADLAVMTGNVAQSCTVTEVALPLVTFGRRRGGHAIHLDLALSRTRRARARP